MDVPLSNHQIEAAWEWNGRLESQELMQLRGAFPKAHEATKIKAITLNVLYGTNVFNIVNVAGILEEFLTKNQNDSDDPEFVETIVEHLRATTNRGYYSFAAKFAHFFINSNLPVLDFYAEWMVQKHLGPDQSKPARRYLKFAEDVKRLMSSAGLTCTCAQLDSYLWIAGEYWYWKKYPKTQVSSDLKDHFNRVEENPEGEDVFRTILGIKPLVSRRDESTVA